MTNHDIGQKREGKKSMGTKGTPDLRDGLPDAAAAHRVEAGGGLVQDHHRGHPDHGAAHRQAAAHAAAQPGSRSLDADFEKHRTTPVG